MSGTDEHGQTGDLPALALVSGYLFDDTPCDIALEYVTEVGTGSSAKIHKGYLLGDNPLVVAVKVFGDVMDAAKQQLLVRELHFAREVSMSHPSIVGFLGTATVGIQTAIVSFYMENGNLMQYMKSHPGCDKKKLILQVAEAVEFLHVEKGLVHGDLKCDNILVSDFGNALLADFGLSSFVEKSERLSTTMTAIRAMHTVQFAAPELLGAVGDDETVSKKTTASDIYAFGMLVLEAISEQPPWGKKKNVAVIKSVNDGQHPPRSTRDGTFVSMSHSWWDVCRSCWRFISHERPQIKDVLRVLKASEYLPCRELPLHGSMAKAAWMPDGQTIVVASMESTRMFDIFSGRVRHLDGPEKATGAYNPDLAVCPNGRHIACGSGETIRVLDAASGALVTSLHHDAPLSCIAYSHDGTRIASGTYRDHTFRLWDTATGVASEWKTGQELRKYYRQNPCAVSFSPDGSCFAAACYDGKIHILDSSTCAPMATLELPEILNCPCSIEFDPEGMHLVVAYDEGMMIFRDVRDRRTAHSFFSQAGDSFRDVAFSPSGRYVAVSGFGEIEIWDVQGSCQVGAPLKSSGDEESIVSVAFSPDGKSLLSAAFEGKIRVWDLFD